MSARLFAFFCIPMLLIATLAHAQQAEDRIPWSQSFNEAAELAARERKLILLHFWADDCPPCRRLEANVFSRVDIAQTMTTAFVPVKVHVDRSPELARRYQVTRWPTDVIVTPAGLEVFRSISPQDPAKYVAMLNEVSVRSGTLAQKTTPAPSTSLAGPTSAPQGPPPQMAAAPPAVAGQTFANQFAGPNEGAQKWNNGATFGGQANAAPPMVARNSPPSGGNFNNPAPAQAGPYQPRSAPVESTPVPSPARPSSPAGGDFNPGGDFVAQGPSVNDKPNYNPAPSPKVESPKSDYQSDFGGPAPESSLPTPPRFPENNTADTPASKPSLPSPPPANNATTGNKPPLPPLGLDGFCVIALAEQGKWVKGDRRYGAIHRGRLYLFTGVAEQQKFLAAPDRYSPALAGYDAVVFAETGKLVDGHRSHGLMYNQQMYLFADEAALQKFQASPRAFADVVYQAMIRNEQDTKLR